MKQKNLPLLGAAMLALAASPVRAHCPLCTVGAAVAAGGAAYLGVDKVVIGLFLGAFAASMGWWVAGLIKKRYIPFQKGALVLFSYATTIFPLVPMLGEAKGWYVALWGSYGTLFHRTYLFDPFIVGSVLGMGIIAVTPWLSRKLTAIRNGKMLPYQGIGLTFGLLLFLGIVLQVMA